MASSTAFEKQDNFYQKPSNTASPRMKRQQGFKGESRTSVNKYAKVAKDEISSEVFKLIQQGEWSQLLDFLNHFRNAACEWITEHNADGTVRWRSLPLHLVSFPHSG